MSATQETRSHFVYLLRPKRPATVKDLTPEEEAVLDEHRVYLRSLAQAGCLVLAGRCPEEGLGLVVLEAPSAEAARSLAEEDPAVLSGVMTAEVHSFLLTAVPCRTGTVVRRGGSRRGAVGRGEDR